MQSRTPYVFGLENILKISFWEEKKKIRNELPFVAIKESFDTNSVFSTLHVSILAICCNSLELQHYSLHCRKCWSLFFSNQQQRLCAAVLTCETDPRMEELKGWTSNEIKCSCLVLIQLQREHALAKQGRGKDNFNRRHANNLWHTESTTANYCCALSTTEILSSSVCSATVMRAVNELSAWLSWGHFEGICSHAH